MKTDYYLGISEEGFHRIAYTEWGHTHPLNSPIICVHGLTRNRHDFDSLASYLSEHEYHVFCPDIVGRGDSDWLKNPLHYTYEQYIADVNVMIARINADQINWIGTSMGGLLGMILASLPKSPIRCLVLNDIGPQIPSQGLARLSKYAGQDPSFSSIEEAKSYFKMIYADFGDLNNEQWLHLTENSIREIAQGRYTTKLDQGIKVMPAKSKIAWRVLLHPLKALEGTLFDMNLWDIWRKVSCPVLVIHGTHSDILLLETIQKMQQTHPNVEVIEVPNAGHAPALLDPKHQDLIYQWLGKLS